MHQRTKNITLSVIIVLVTFIVTGKDVFSENDARIVVNKQINLCKSDDKRFIFSVNIGEIKTTDSLFGFDIEIAYDKNKVKILSALTGNTLSEAFEERSFSYGYEENKIKGYAITMKFNIIPPSGNKDLIAFYAEWVGETECEDSAKISITRLEFTDEFKKQINNYIPRYIYTKLIPNENEISIISPNNSNYILKSGERQFTVKYTANLASNHKVNIIDIKFVENNVIRIKDVITESSNVRIEGFGDDYITLTLINEPITFDFKVIYEYLLKDTISNYIYKSKIIDLNECNCLGAIKDISFKITKDSSFASIAESCPYISYECLNNTIKIHNEKIKRIKFVDVLGRELGIFEVGRPTEIKIDNTSANMIFAIIEINDKIEIKKFNKCY